MARETELMTFAEELAREAGELAHRRRAEGVDIAATKSTLADIVTAADREVEQLIRERIAAERPDDGFVGEEFDALRGRSGVTWVVDPIDGTVNYAGGSPFYAVSIAAVEGEPRPREWMALAGVVHAPALGETFRAARGEGAFLDGRRLAVAEPHAAGALVATGFGYDPATHAGDLATLARVFVHARDIRRTGSASLDLASVAAGRVDAYYERGLSPWDHAAGALLVTEAGGVVSWADVASARPMIIAAAPTVHATLTDVLV